MEEKEMSNFMQTHERLVEKAKRLETEERDIFPLVDYLAELTGLFTAGMTAFFKTFPGQTEEESIGAVDSYLQNVRSMVVNSIRIKGTGKGNVVYPFEIIKK